MAFIRFLYMAIIIFTQIFTYAIAGDQWMDAPLDSLGSIFKPIKVPTISGLHTNSVNLNLDSSNSWTSTKLTVEGGKLIQFKWSASGLSKIPDKYRVMYRIDPRFSTPQIFIQKYNYTTKKYVSDFHHFKDGELLKYQDKPEMDFYHRVVDYSDYFSFINRSKILVRIGDVVNITLDNKGQFFGADSEMNQELSANTQAGVLQLLSVYTQTSLDNNNILLASTSNFCAAIENISDPNYINACRKYPNHYYDVNLNWNTYIGKIDNVAVNSIKYNNIPVCDDNVNSLNADSTCKYNLGRGMAIHIAGTQVKDSMQKFIHSQFSSKDFFYYKSDVEGYLEFLPQIDISNMYNSKKQLMSSWGSLSKTKDSFTDGIDSIIFALYIDTFKSDLTMNYIYTGRYLMEIEIGSSDALVNTDDLEGLKIEYYISKTDTPNSSTSGTVISQDYRGNASTDGYLWFRVTNPNSELTGSISVTVNNYTGSTWFSHIVYDDIIHPLQNNFQKLSNGIYTKLVTDPALVKIAGAMLTLYIVIYGLLFVTASVQLTINDVVVRVFKIAMIVALFSSISWEFFNNYLFTVFINGTEYLMRTVIGVTSSVNNIFGFVDPIIDKYTHGDIWLLLFIQLLQIQNGLTFFAIMTVYGILIFFRAVLQVIVGYCLAFVGISVMISLAPFFIILILFERTKGIFEKWLATLFSQMLLPTILLIFFLLIDQLMGDIITRTIVEAKWGALIPIKIGLDLTHIGIPISFSFTLPFLPDIPFYIPQVKGVGQINDFFSGSGTFSIIATSSFLFFALCKLADGLVDYVTLVTQYLTNVLASRQDGKLQQESNPIKDITNDMGKLARPVTGAAKRLGGFAKEKIVDQKISSRASSGKAGDIDYDRYRKSSSPDSNEDSGGLVGSGEGTGGPTLRTQGKNASESDSNEGSVGSERSGVGTRKPTLRKRSKNASESDSNESSVLGSERSGVGTRKPTLRKRRNASESDSNEGSEGS